MSEFGISPEDQELYFQQLNDLVQTEEKIVTSASFALNNNLSLKNCEIIIKNYVEDCHKLQKPLNATYLLCGKLEGENVGVFLIKESELEEKGKLFEEITSKIIYSIQKGANIDYNSLNLANTSSCLFVDSYIGTNCVRKAPVKGTEPGVAVGNEAKNGPNSVPGSSKVFEKKSQQKKGMSAFLTKSQNKPKIENESKLSKPKAETNGINSTATNDENKISNQVEVKQEKVDTKIVRPKIEKEAKTPKVVEKKNFKRKSTTKEESSGKRRKRIQAFSDSDSDKAESDHNEELFEESYDEPAPREPEKAPITPGRSKVKKAIEETHIDEEGYMVTQIKYVMKSDSEAEEETEQVIQKAEPQKKDALLKQSSEESVSGESAGKSKGKSGKKAAKKSTNNGSAALMMNFFKKC